MDQCQSEQRELPNFPQVSSTILIGMVGSIGLDERLSVITSGKYLIVW